MKTIKNREDRILQNNLSDSILTSPTALCAEKHKNLGLLQVTNQAELPTHAFLPIALFELAEAVRLHPVFFIGDTTITPVVITGISAHQQIIYQPVINRLYPFSLRKLNNENAGAIIFDNSCPRLTSCKENKSAIPLFDNTGNPSDLLRLITNTAVQHYAGQQQAEIFATALKEAGVLTVSQLEFTSAVAEQKKTHRFYMLNEKAYRNLPADTVHDWFKKGWLDAASLILASHIHWYQHLNKSQIQQQAGA